MKKEEGVPIPINYQPEEIIQNDSLNSEIISKFITWFIPQMTTERKQKWIKRKKLLIKQIRIRIGWSKIALGKDKDLISIETGKVIFRKKKDVLSNQEYSFNHKGEVMLSKKVDIEKLMNQNKHAKTPTIFVICPLNNPFR